MSENKNKYLNSVKERVYILYVAIILAALLVILYLSNIQIVTTGDYISQTLSMTEFFK